MAATVLGLGRFADWDESLHPRDENGRFGPGGGGSDKGGEEGGPAERDVSSSISDLLARFPGGRIPDAVAAPVPSATADAGPQRTDFPAAFPDDVSSFLDDEYRWVENAADDAWESGVRGHGDSTAAHMAERLGYAGRPEVTSREALDDRVAAGQLELFRGVNGGDGNHDPEALAEQYRTGDYFFGGGITLNGTYFSTDRAEAGLYAEQAGGGGVVMRAAVDPSARVVDISDLRADRDGLAEKFAEARDRAYQPGGGGSAEAERLREVERVVTGDLSRLAMLRGYDVVVHESSQNMQTEVVVLNRSKLAVEK